MTKTESDTMFGEIVENSLFGVYLIQDGIFRYVNRRLAEIFGYAPEELIDIKGPIDLVMPNDWPIVEENLRKRLSGESKAIHYVFRGRRRDGGIIHIEACGFPTIYRELPAVAGTLADITGRKRAEEMLQEQKDFLQKAIESVTAPFYVIDASDHSILLANSASGFDGREGSQTCYTLTHNREEPCNCSEHPCPLEIVKKTGKATTVEHVHSDSNGNTSIFEIHGYPITDETGLVTKMVEHSLNITERKQCEEKKEHLIEELQSALSRIKTLEGLLTICSHCKKIKDDEGYWNQVESYIRQHSDAQFTHGICPECAQQFYPEYFDKGWGKRQ